MIDEFGLKDTNFLTSSRINDMQKSMISKPLVKFLRLLKFLIKQFRR